MIADALDLRYRLPRLWGRVLTGGVRAWQARKIAEQTRALSWEACADVDHALSDFVGMMPWARFAKILSAAVLEADPALAAERAERARAAQDVFSFDSVDGLKTVVAKAAAGDAIWFLATVNRIAEILAALGDTNPIGTRRARDRDFGPARGGTAAAGRAPARPHRAACRIHGASRAHRHVRRRRQVRRPTRMRARLESGNG